MTDHHGTGERLMLAKIEQMVIDLLPISSDGTPDIDDAAGPDIAQLVLQTRDCNDKTPFPSIFENRSDAEGWFQIAHDLARALITMDKEHRKILKAIRDVGSDAGTVAEP